MVNLRQIENRKRTQTAARKPAEAGTPKPPRFNLQHSARPHPTTNFGYPDFEK